MKGVIIKEQGLGAKFNLGSNCVTDNQKLNLAACIYKKMCEGGAKFNVGSNIV